MSNYFPWRNNVRFLYLSLSRFVQIEEGARELLGIERPQIIDAFTDADPFHGHGKLRFQSDDDAALRRAIKLRQNDARDRRRFLKEIRLADRILPQRSHAEPRG